MLYETFENFNLKRGRKSASGYSSKRNFWEKQCWLLRKTIPQIFESQKNVDEEAMTRKRYCTRRMKSSLGTKTRFVEEKKSVEQRLHFFQKACFIFWNLMFCNILSTHDRVSVKFANKLKSVLGSMKSQFLSRSPRL